METITKRLHISGLTPSLSPADLSKRLSTFGTVKALDGFGLLDGVGQPRKFGYATLEATPAQLAKCLNVLSGSTWKGAKLRIGDAKPDYAQRIEKERAEAQDAPPPKKKRRCSKYTAVEAEDMSLVTPQNAHLRAGWTVTTLGRIMRPMRMRPERPLMPLPKPPADGKASKKRKIPLVRARRRTIDMRRWEGAHLTGVFLGGGVPLQEGDDAEDKDEYLEEQRSDISVEEDSGILLASSMDVPSSSALQKITPAVSSQTDMAFDLTAEKRETLGLLQSLFGGGDNTKEWGGAESIASDIDVDEQHLLEGDGEADYEVVPLDTSQEKPMNPSPAGESSTEVETTTNTTKTKLKDLFAPRADEGGFSLMGHLNLDFEMDEEVTFPTAVAEIPVPEALPTVEVVPTPIPALSHLVLDPKKPLFFPLSSSFPTSEPSASRPRVKNIFDVAREKHWTTSLSSTGGFHRMATEEDIRKRWEESKGELTRGWKKRVKDAGKMKRRRGTVADEGV
ncbi:uncharacterized protein BT62DRAFT_960538 [Guyanagaster necrorhizus]|uniref:RRM domain-containing protein n=1 Tax=Guyanagaster necrorhizus TaxID=856835 RepID=A0A9P8AX22_9AGAR|nr:uncharacterized protein BT62DRAFT_960538 [Guyanagaster necrorhizus MCA 3950]KAG7450980.1 hypothetical protein BT62DRAFT_960538 [Guyanagaster necrorhizus MCA 3950]